MRVNQIFDEAAQIVGTPDKKEVYLALTNAIQALSLEGDWDATTGFVDICSCADYCFALPNDVEAPLAVNIGGAPAIFRDSFYQFHLNGPGSSCGASIDWSWVDEGVSPVVQNIINPSQIISQVYDPVDYGTPVRVYGYQRLSDGTEVPVYTNGPSKSFPNHYMTSEFIMPNPGVYVTINLNSTDSIYAGLNLIVRNPTTGRLNSFTVIQAVNSTQVQIRNDGSNEAAGTVFPTTSSLRYSSRQEGWLVPTVQYSIIDENAPYFTRITAITKNETAGFIKLAALDTGRENGTLLSFLMPQELESRYRKIRVPRCCQWIRMKYLKVSRPIESCQDEILTDCKMALMSMLRALRKLKEEDVEGYAQHKMIALDFMQKSEEQRHPDESGSLSVNVGVAFGVTENMI